MIASGALRISISLQSLPGVPDVVATYSFQHDLPADVGFTAPLWSANLPGVVMMRLVSSASSKTQPAWTGPGTYQIQGAGFRNRLTSVFCDCCLLNKNRRCEPTFRETLKVSALTVNSWTDRLGWVKSKDLRASCAFGGPGVDCPESGLPCEHSRLGERRRLLRSPKPGC